MLNTLQQQNYWVPITGQIRNGHDDYTKVSNLYNNKDVPQLPLTSTSEIPLFLKSLLEGIQTTSYAKADEQPAERQTHLTTGENACRMIKQYAAIIVHTRQQEFPSVELLCSHMAMHMSYPKTSPQQHTWLRERMNGDITTLPTNDFDYNLLPGFETAAAQYNANKKPVITPEIKAIHESVLQRIHDEDQSLDINDEDFNNYLQPAENKKIEASRDNCIKAFDEASYLIKLELEKRYREFTPGIDKRDGITLLNTIIAKLVANPEELNQNITSTLHNLNNYHLQARLPMFKALFPLTAHNTNGIINLTVYLNYLNKAYESIDIHMHQMNRARAIIRMPGSTTHVTLNELLQAIETDINNYVSSQLRYNQNISSRPQFGRSNNNTRNANTRRTGITTEPATTNTSNTGPSRRQTTTRRILNRPCPACAYMAYKTGVTNPSINHHIIDCPHYSSERIMDKNTKKSTNYKYTLKFESNLTSLETPNNFNGKDIFALQQFKKFYDEIPKLEGDQIPQFNTTTSETQ